MERISRNMLNSTNKTTNITTPYSTENSFSFVVRFVSTFCLIDIIILTLVGNSLVIRAFVVFRKLRNVTNYFVVSLAVTDILVAVFSMPVWVAFLLTGPDWIFSLWLMHLWKSMDIVCGLASIFHLLLISIERYICISSPLKYLNIVTTGKTGVAIIGAWMFAVIMAVIKLLLLGMSAKAYQIATFVLCFAGPVLVMGSMYVMIFRVSRTQAKKMILKIGEKTKRFSLPKEMKAAKTLGVVMGAFVLCWFPFFFLNILHALCRSCQITAEAVMVAKALHYFNSALNPIIYSLMNKQFRAAFRHLFCYIYPNGALKKSDRRFSIFSSLRSKNSTQETNA